VYMRYPIVVVVVAQSLTGVILSEDGENSRPSRRACPERSRRDLLY